MEDKGGGVVRGSEDGGSAGGEGGEAMPGRLIMDQQGPLGSHDLKKERAQAQTANLPPKPDFTQKQAAPPVSAPDNHAVNGAVPNGVPSQGQHPSTTNGNAMIGPAAASDPESPPALDQSWRDGPNNKSMGTLIDRLAQSCFEDLRITLDKMTEIPADSDDVQTNGALSPTSPSTDSSPASLSKKRTFMEFAKDQRDRFIKTLVLSDWARNSEEMNRLVDIKVMFDHRSRMQRHAIDFIGHVKHDVNRIKIPNPNIDLAMELLATGKASKPPHLGYIPPKKLTAKETLKTLRNMNVMLETRLNLHEELPPHFNDFSVANGKATFRVRGEFEVDLAIADEDTSSQFFFINARFLFSPSPDDIPDILRQQLEPRTNAAIAANGLQGCYEFLHNFVLTHKINTLYDQARQAEREKWFGCVGIQKSRRVVTIQYWREMLGRKNWIEIGVSTGKQQGRRSRRPATPQLSFRWFRRGELVENHGLAFDWENLSLERILQTVVAKHVSWALDATCQRLRTLAGVNSKLEMELHSPAGSFDDFSLKLSLPGMQKPLTTRLESITGRASISPATPRAADQEARLNKQTDPDLALALASLLCNTVKDRVDKTAELAGWSPYRGPIRTDNFKSKFGADVNSWRAFVPNSGWDSKARQWVLFSTFSLAGQKWWIVLLENKPNPTQRPLGQVITAREVSVDSVVTSHTASAMSRSLFLQIEKLAAAEVSFAVLSEQLSSEKIPHRVQKTASLTNGESSAYDGSMPMSTMLIQLQGLLRTTFGSGSAVDAVTITNQGFITGGDTSSANIGHELRLTVDDRKLKHLRKHLLEKRQPSDIAMNASGGLALKLQTPFGEPFFGQIKELLQSCVCLDAYLAGLILLDMTPVVVATTKFTFIYSRTPDLSATITFRGGPDKSMATLKLEPPAVNPQQRQRLAFEKLINNTATPNRFEVLCRCLKYSLPVMRLFEKLEAASPTRKEFTVTIMSELMMKLTYNAPLPACTFYIELAMIKRNNGATVCVWRISPGQERTPRDLGTTAFGRALISFAVKNKHGKVWQGLEDGTLAAPVNDHADSGALALEALDQMVRSFKEEDHPLAKQQPPAPSQPAATQQRPAPTNSRPAPGRTNSNNNSSAARNNQSKVKKEVIELD